MRLEWAHPASEDGTGLLKDLVGVAEVKDPWRMETR